MTEESPAIPLNTTDSDNSAKWDLTSTISPHLDLHMMFPLLAYSDQLVSSGLISYTLSDVAHARLCLLRPTHMVDYAMDIYRELHYEEGSGKEVEIPKEMEEQKAQVFVKLEELRAGCRDLEALCGNHVERMKLMESDQWNLAGLEASTHRITPAIVDKYRQLAKFNYDCGDYQTCRDMLETYLSLFAASSSSNHDEEDKHDDDGLLSDGNTKGESKEGGKEDAAGHPKMYNIATSTLVSNPSLLESLWGMLSCEILLEQWEAAGIALDAVKTGLEELSSRDSPAMKPLDALIQRTWLLHWGLFVFWNNNASLSSHPHGLDTMVELFTTEKYLQAITTNAPHLLRYLTAAVLLIKRRKTASLAGQKPPLYHAATTQQKDGARLMKDLVKIMQHCSYTDPIVEFVDCLCVKFDFERAQTKLAECERVLETDFFLCRQTALFMEEARVFVFENYCRIHHKIDLAALGEKLAMDAAAAERWIVDLIRNALLDAKIDSSERCVVMGADAASVYEQVMERTKDLNLRTSTLAQNLHTVMNEVRREKGRRARAALEEDY